MNDGCRLKRQKCEFLPGMMGGARERAEEESYRLIWRMVEKSQADKPAYTLEF